MSDEQFIGNKIFENVVVTFLFLLVIFLLVTMIAGAQELPAHPQSLPNAPSFVRQYESCHVIGVNTIGIFPNAIICGDKCAVESTGNPSDCQVFSGEWYSLVNGQPKELPSSSSTIQIEGWTEDTTPVESVIVVKKPSFLKRTESLAVSNDHYMLALDGALRAMDAKSTHDLLSNPCHCFKEDDPIAPHTGNYAAQALFQSGAMMAVMYGHNMLVNHHHNKLAKVLVIIDIASESYAVGHNMSLATPKPLPPVPVIAPVVFK